MTFFEFIMIITSVIYALCIAPLLSGFVRILQFDGNVEYYLPQALVAVWLFIVVAVIWWTTWAFRNVDWFFATYFYMIMEPVTMFVACSLIFPGKLDGDHYSLKSHYNKVRVPLVTAMLLGATLVFADGILLGTEKLWESRRALQLGALGLMLWALIDKRSTAQYAMATGVLTILFSLLALWFWVPAN